MKKILSIGFIAIMLSLVGTQTVGASYSYGGHTSGSRPVTPITPVVTPVVGQVLGAESFNFTKRLAKGANNTEVMELQKFLNTAGFDCGIADGKFGPKTKVGVINFQISKGLKGDGVVGPLTRAFLK